MGEAAYSPDGIKKLEDLGATEVIVAFRNAYEGGPDERTLDGMIAEINWYAEEVITINQMNWSGWPDLNRRPPHPQCGALPGCATSRN